MTTKWQLGTNLDEALKMCNGERRTIIDYLEFLNEINSTEIINKLISIPKENKEQVTLLIINKLHEIPNASNKKNCRIQDQILQLFIFSCPNLELYLKK